MTVSEKAFISLLANSACGLEMDSCIIENLTEDVLEDVFKLSQIHSVVNVVADALLKNGILSQGKAKNKFYNALIQTVVRNENMEYELKRVSELFEKNKIKYMPLKGSVLRNYYREPWLRSSCDVDVLIQESDLSKAAELLVKDLGYTLSSKDPHDWAFTTKSTISLELHFKLIEGLDESGNLKYKWNANCLSDVWQNAMLCKDKNYCYAMSDEFFYFYHIAHMAKHFEHRGCGVRFFIDLWILNHTRNFDKEKVDCLLTEGKLKAFEKYAKALSEMWFSGEQENDILKSMEIFVLRSGTYGTLDNYVRIQQNRRGGKLNYLLSTVFLKYDILKKNYPILEKRKWMYPICQMARWFSIILPGKRKNSTSAKIIKENLSGSTGAVLSTTKLFKKLQIGK